MLSAAVAHIQELEEALVSEQDWPKTLKFLNATATRPLLKNVQNSLTKRQPTTSLVDNVLAAYPESLRRCHLAAGKAIAASTNEGDKALAKIQIGLCTHYSTGVWDRNLIIAQVVQPFCTELAGVLGLKSLYSLHPVSDWPEAEDVVSPSLANAMSKTLQLIVSRQWSKSQKHRIIQSLARVCRANPKAARSLIFKPSSGADYMPLLSELAMELEAPSLVGELLTKHVMTGCQPPLTRQVFQKFLTPAFFESTFLPQWQKLNKRNSALALELLDLVPSNLITSETALDLSTEWFKVLEQGKLASFATLDAILSNDDLLIKLLTHATKAIQVKPRTAYLVAAESIILRRRVKNEDVLQLLTTLGNTEKVEDLAQIIIRCQARILALNPTLPQMKVWLNSWDKNLRIQGLYTLCETAQERGVADTAAFAEAIKPSFTFLLSQLTCSKAKPTMRVQAAMAWAACCMILDITGLDGSALEAEFRNAAVLNDLHSHVFLCDDASIAHLIPAVHAASLLLKQKSIPLAVSEPQSLAEIFETTTYTPTVYTAIIRVFLAASIALERGVKSSRDQTQQLRKHWDNLKFGVGEARHLLSALMSMTYHNAFESQTLPAGVIRNTDGFANPQIYRRTLRQIAHGVKRAADVNEVFGDRSSEVIFFALNDKFASRKVSSQYFTVEWLRNGKFSLPAPHDNLLTLAQKVKQGDHPFSSSLRNMINFCHWPSLKKLGETAQLWMAFSQRVFTEIFIKQLNPTPLFELSKKVDKPVEVKKPVAKPKAKAVSAATAKLIAAKKNVDSKSNAPAGSNEPVALTVSQQKEKAFEATMFSARCLQTAAVRCPDQLASVFDQLLPNVWGLIGCPLGEMAALMLAKTLVNSYVMESTVPVRHLLVPCLAEIARGQVPIVETDAEKICQSLSSDHPLEAEASALVLPVILALLSSDGSSKLSLLAIHRATSILNHQLRLGAQLSSATVMTCVKAVAQLRPSLLSACVEVLAQVPALPDFTFETHLETLASFVANDNARFRRSIGQILLEKVKLDPNMVTVPHFAAYVYAETIGETDTAAKEMFEKVLENQGKWVAKPAIEKLQDLIDLLSNESAVFRRIVGVAAATLMTSDPQGLIDAAQNAFETQYKPLVVEKVDERLAGFQLRQEDLARIQASADESKVDQTPCPPGRLGCLTMMRCLVTQSKVSWSIGSQVQKFILDKVIKGAWIDPALQTEAEDLGVAVCSANSTAVQESLDTLLAQINRAVVKVTAQDHGLSAVCAAMLGAQSKHLDSRDAKLVAVFEALNNKLKGQTSTMAVKRAAFKALPLILQKLIASETRTRDDLLTQFKNTALNEKDVKVRVGGALGLAALVKSQGFVMIKEANILDDLALQVQERKETWARHGGFLCYEAIIEALGRLIETYAVQILPVLLLGLADMQAVVREAAAIVARKLMTILSGQGLQLVLPSLISTARDPNWRKKSGSLELLSNVASVSPAHLASVLTQVLPVFCEAAHDSHKDVKAIANRGLTSLSHVIANPEIRAMSDTVVACLIDGSSKNLEAFLDGVTNLTLAHKLEGSTLSFVCPILLKGLSATRTEHRIKATQVVAILPNITITPQQSLLPYVKPMIQEIRANLSDPVPEVRRNSSRCLGVLTKELGSCVYAETLPWLIKALRSCTNSVERSGAANALVEVFFALGRDSLAQHLPDILKQAHENVDAGVREGFLGLFVYMPLIFQDEFQDFVPQVLPVLLGSLAAEEEPVRDIAYRASQIFVQQYGSTHTPLLLQPLEGALFNEFIEVRLRAVSLLGSLVEKILKGVEDSTAEGGQLMQLEILSLERRSYILSALYLARSDSEVEVRHAAATVWKSVVQNTPRTVRELLPILTKRLLDLLASDNAFKETVSSRCMEELVVKHGEKLLPEVMAIFESTLKEKPEKARGVFVGLTAVINSAPKHLLKTYTQKLLPLIRETLKQTSDDEIRKQIISVINLLAKSEQEAARETRGGPSSGQSKKFIEPFIADFINPPVFNVAELSLVRADSQKTLEVFIESQGTMVVSEIVSKCNQDPVDISKVRLLGCVSVCSPEMVRQLWTPTFAGLQKAFRLSLSDERVKNAAQFQDEISQSALRMIQKLNTDFAYEILGTFTELITKNPANFDVSAVGWTKLAAEASTPPTAGTVEAMLNSIEASHLALEVSLTQSSDRMFGFLVADQMAVAMKSTPDVLKPHVDTMVKVLLPAAMCELSSEAHALAAQAWINLTKALSKDAQIAAGLTVHSVLTNITANPLGEGFFEPKLVLPGCLHKGVFEAVSSVLHTALLYGAANVREAAAEGLLALITVADGSVLTVKTAGPLIRIFAERVTSEVKASVLKCLIAMLQMTEGGLKALVPQLQSTFVRSLLDSSSPEVRRLAGLGLKTLAPLAGPRVDLLLRELSKNALVSEYQQSLLEAICDVTEVVANDLLEATRNSVWTNLLSLTTASQSECTLLAGRILGLLLASDTAFAESIWAKSVRGGIDDDDEKVAIAIEVMITKSPETIKWLEDSGHLAALEKQLDMAVDSESLSVGLCRLVAALGAIDSVHTERLITYNLEVADFVAEAGQAAVLDEPGLCLEAIKTLRSLAMRRELKDEHVIELASKLAPLLRATHPALKMQTERLIANMLTRDLHQLDRLRNEASLKFVIEYYDRVLAKLPAEATN